MIISHGWIENCYQVLTDIDKRIVITFVHMMLEVIVIVLLILGATIGINEKHDLHAIVSYIVDNYQPTTLGLMGYSMGGTTIIEYVKYYKPVNINFMIVDGIFATLT